MKVLILLIAVFSTSTFAGEIKNNTRIKNAFHFEFNEQKVLLLEDAKLQTEQEEKETYAKKSGFKAALLSAVLPGAGEFYAESYWKSALFAAIEVAAWAGYFTYTDRGDSKDRTMRKLGDARWSEQRYWSRVYDLASDPANNQWQYDPLSIDGNNIISAADLTEETIERLRVLESEGGFDRFTHTLPRTKTQQYYEMIYKYLPQFGAGWEELGTNWGYYDGGANLNRLTSDVARYKNLRNKSNDFYRTATSMGTVVLLNHLASAIDAAFTVKSYNKSLNYSFYSGQQRYAGEPVNTFGLALSW